MSNEAEAPNAAASPELTDRALYINRELSWLAFNDRVLGQALTPPAPAAGEPPAEGWPLLERLKFLAIHAANLDEFFMIRVSGLHEQLEANAIIEATPDGLSPRDQLTQIHQVVRKQVQQAERLLADEILPALAARGLHLRDWKDLHADVKREARRYFRSAVFPVLTPLAVDPGHPFPFLSNLSLSLAVEARDPDTGERKFARVKVPESLPRFVSLNAVAASVATDGNTQDFLPLEQLIAANLDDLFPGLEILSCYPFRVTRDMDIDILEDEAHDLLSAVDREIRQRRFGACVRLEVAAGVPDRIRRMLLEKLEIDEEDAYASAGPLGLASLFELASLSRPELRDAPFASRVPPELADGRDLFAAIRQRDILLHHPYDSFGAVLDFLRQAADDPKVLAIKMTLYRAGTNAEAVRALVSAAEKGKQVAVSIEIKARFDEENNIAWARALERAGAHVFFGRAASKTHAKVVLVVRQESDGLRRYVHVSTGNYNASTARLYTDVGMFTANTEIGEDVSDLFNSLSGFSKKPRYRRLAVAPITLADTFLAKIDAQAEKARAGGKGHIFAKLNSLVDVPVIQALYRASRAGVSIDLCVRGICCLRPGVPGVSENIRVFSIVGRFLEHERIFVFGEPGQADTEYFLSSADWMPRNLHRRVEIMVPVLAVPLRERLHREVLRPALADNASVWDMDAEGRYTRRTCPAGAKTRQAQQDVLTGALDDAPAEAPAAAPAAKPAKRDGKARDAGGSEPSDLTN
ncbi:MAG TPA: polyphosphate kinase 1 [Polyangia bacterium]|nr:polyphosphate kinase 1 [Polyangia bacterium]